MKYIALSVLACILAACGQQPSPTTTKAQLTSSLAENKAPKPLDAYWYQGKAEITRYELQQNRYRDLHPGEALLVFVTEDFLTDKQVKNDNYKNTNSINVLKTNYINRFTTGLYDYSIMTSVFTPADAAKHPQTLKVTMSSQDWCGQSFMQTNWRNNRYETQVRSYFEQEADENFDAAKAILEDELFNRIRINPAALPTGQINILPSLSHTRLQHTKFHPARADAVLKAYEGKDFEGDNLQMYQVTFSDSKRVLTIVFEQQAPYKIAGWMESHPSFDGQVRRTIAKRTHTVLTPYWQQNGLADRALRKQLGLSE